MEKYTQKTLKNMVAAGAAKCINDWNFETTKEFLHSHNIEKIGLSSGIYGMNGGLIQDKTTGELYAITGRNSVLFQIF